MSVKLFEFYIRKGKGYKIRRIKQGKYLRFIGNERKKKTFEFRLPSFTNITVNRKDFIERF